METPIGFGVLTALKKIRDLLDVLIRDIEAHTNGVTRPGANSVGPIPQPNGDGLTGTIAPNAEAMKSIPEEHQASIQGTATDGPSEN